MNEKLSPLEAIFGSQVIETLQRAPMPAYDGYEPDELAMVRIQRRVEQGRFDDLSKDENKWVFCRLIPALVRYGCYPPPAPPSDREEAAS